MTRLERLRPSLEEPLLVTAPANIRYLVGFSSSNAALLIEPDGAQLFSDFRYAETGRRVAEVEFIEAKRNLYADLAERLSGPIGFEANAVTFAQHETLGAKGLELKGKKVNASQRKNMALAFGEAEALNAGPKATLALYRAFAAGDYKKAGVIQRIIAPAAGGVTEKYGIAGLKAVT